MKAARKTWVKEIMVDWLTFTDNLMEMTKADVLHALELERKRETPRSTVIRRLKQRYNSIASDEVRKDIE